MVGGNIYGDVFHRYGKMCRTLRFPAVQQQEIYASHNGCALIAVIKGMGFVDCIHQMCKFGSEVGIVCIVLYMRQNAFQYACVAYALQTARHGDNTVVQPD